jgi:uncharacterized membrane protein YphA (DoxX/SURF4 family)
VDIISVLARWYLGIVFVYMGMSKALNPYAFAELIREYHMVNSTVLLNSVAGALPWFEVFCGLLLVAGVGVRGAAVMLIAMLVPFTLLVLKRALAVASAKAIAFCAVKFDCGCGNGEVFICHKLPENCALMLLAAWLLAGYGRQLCLRYELLRPRQPLP